jgi:hypothetical protein
MADTNRAQRRAEKFGKHRPQPEGGWPASEPNPAYTGQGGEEDEAHAGRPDQDQTKQTGAGTGGATEQATRVPRHSGTHSTNSAKG